MWYGWSIKFDFHIIFNVVYEACTMCHHKQGVVASKESRSICPPKNKSKKRKGKKKERKGKNKKKREIVTSDLLGGG